MNDKIINSLKNYTLLFVENENGIRENFREYFELLFQKVYTAKDGVEALEVYNSSKIDLIITDIKMPNMDGIKLVKTIREKNKDINIVIISAHTDVEYLLDSIPLNLIQYIVKPLTEDKLVAVFEEFLKLNETLPFIYSKEKSEIHFDNQTFMLSLKENLFIDKILNKNRIVTYEEIEHDIWDGKLMSQNALRVFIRDLRKKLPKEFLKNIPNQGYSKNTM